MNCTTRSGCLLQQWAADVCWRRPQRTISTMLHLAASACTCSNAIHLLLFAIPVPWSSTACPHHACLPTCQDLEYPEAKVAAALADLPKVE